MIRCNDDERAAPFADPLIDEVRAIRREICDEFGNDVASLAIHLRQVEAEFRSGTGRFAGLLDVANQDVVAGWGDSVNDLSDPLIEEIRKRRR